MNIIDALMGEHAALTTVFDHMRKYQSSWDLGRYHEAGELLSSLLATHAILEDELLFDPIMTGEGRLGQTLRIMRHEHDELRHLVSGLFQTTEVIGARSVLDHLIEVTREHFALEERILFGMAAEVLGPDRLRQIGDEWALRRQLSLSVPST